MADPDRRRFLKVATCAVGGGLGLVVVAPALRLFADPMDRTTVKTPTEPIDVGSIERFPLNTPTKVSIVAAEVTDAWTSAHDVVLGSAWVKKTSATTFEVFSSVCPHLGCAVDFTGKEFLCPCHQSKFTVAGAVTEGAIAKRGLDALDHTIVDGHLHVTWARFVLDTTDKTVA